jgi:hypothetical protein
MTKLPFPFPIAPPPNPQKIEVDAAEFLALRVIVMACATHLACEAEKSTGVAAQSWINDLSALCQESILASNIGEGDDRERGKRLASRAVEHINRILGGIRLPAPNGDDPH